jgi:hypothetical protein
MRNLHPFLPVILLMVLISSAATAQDTAKPYCGFGAIRAKQGLGNAPQFKTNNPLTDEGQYFIIPVVIHIIHNGGVENIPDYLVQRQIDVLNEDYGHYGRGYNSFPFGGDSKIRYCLATIDPNGNPSSGIEHIQSPFTDLTTDNEMLTKNLSNWDHNRYLNIWVVRSIDASKQEQGYAYLASDVARMSNPDADGIVVTYRFFGRFSPYAIGNYKYGRTVTHESGHYLNLMHTWGGDGAGEGGCNDDDGVDDTPDCSNPYYSSYKGHIADSCDDPVQCGYVRLIQDYMDYSEDACMDVFTLGQIYRMRQAILKYRFGLTTYQNAIATGCQVMYLQYNIFTEDAFDISPNPSTGMLNLYPHFTGVETGEVYIYDAEGRLMRHITVTGMYTAKVSIDLNWAANGIYNVIIITPKQTYSQKLVLQHLN